MFGSTHSPHAELADRARNDRVASGASPALYRLVPARQRGADEVVTVGILLGRRSRVVYTAGDVLEMAPFAELTPDVISRFLFVRYVGALSAVRVIRSAHRRARLDHAHQRHSDPLGVNAVTPGVVRTPLWDTFSDADRQAMYDQAAQRLPLGRIGEVDDVALAYIYCMEQRYGTGTVLTVDGGTVPGLGGGASATRRAPPTRPLGLGRGGRRRGRRC